MARPKLKNLTGMQHKSFKNFLVEEMGATENEADLIINLYRRDVIEWDSVEDIIVGLAPDEILLQIKLYIKLFRNVDSTLTSFFLRNLRASVRRKVMETYQLNPLETYIYSVLLNAKKKGVVIGTNTLIKMLKKYKHVEITDSNINYYRSMINKVRRKVPSKSAFQEGRDKPV